MILHTATPAAGKAVVPDCRRLVVCDSLDQPLAVFVDTGGQVMMVLRGDKDFDNLVALAGVGVPARTVDVSLGG